MLSASSSFRHLRYAGLCTCRYSFSTMFQRNPAGQKMHVIEWGVCRWQTVLYTWLNLNRRLNLVLCPHRYIGAQHSTHDWSSRRGLSRDTSDGLRYNWQAAAYISMFWSTCSIRPKLLPLHRGEVKHWLYRRGKPQYSISGSLEIQGMVRGYSFDIRFTLQCGNIQSGYSVDIPSMVFLLPARAHLVPNQGSSGLALVSRLKLDRVSLMGIRVEFETKCQCLYWSLIKSLRKQICSLFRIPFW